MSERLSIQRRFCKFHESASNLPTNLTTLLVKHALDNTANILDRHIIRLVFQNFVKSFEHCMFLVLKYWVSSLVIIFKTLLKLCHIDCYILTKITHWFVHIVLGGKILCKLTVLDTASIDQRWRVGFKILINFYNGFHDFKHLFIERKRGSFVQKIFICFIRYFNDMILDLLLKVKKIKIFKLFLRHEVGSTASHYRSIEFRKWVI